MIKPTILFSAWAFPAVKWGLFPILAQTEVIKEAMEVGKKGATLGSEALLFLSTITLGGVIIILHRLREKTRVEERTEMKEQFSSFVLHHENSIKTFNEERSAVTLERKATIDTLLRVLHENTEALSGMKEFLASRDRK